MKVITEVKWVEVDKEILELSHMQRPEFPIRLDTENGAKTMSAEVVREFVRGTRLVNPFNGMDVILGVSTGAAEIIGCAYEAFEAMQLNLDAKSRELSARERDLAEIRSAGFLTRLKWLFTGVAPEL